MTLPDLAVVQSWIDESPFNRWLGIKVAALTQETVTFEVDARDEWVSNTKFQSVHGGVVSALLDTAADFSLIGALGEPVPTIDFSVNFLRTATAGPLRVEGRLVKPGRQIATAEAELFDAGGKLLAVARGTFLASATKGSDR